MMEKHTQNIALYISLGGDPKKSDKLTAPTLENRAKMSYLLSQLSKVSPKIPPKIETKVEEEKPKPETKISEKPRFLGLISQYPVALHATYNEAYNLWIEVCSIKIQLNAVADDNEDEAYALQYRMMSNLRRFDRCKVALDHYLQYARLLPTETKDDYTNMSPTELQKEKSNVSGLISRRKKTIQNMEDNLPGMDDPTYRKKVAAINLKKEKLEDYILKEEKLLELLGY